jgi:hypothetical protein
MPSQKNLENLYKIKKNKIKNYKYAINALEKKLKYAGYFETKSIKKKIAILKNMIKHEQCEILKLNQLNLFQ